MNTTRHGYTVIDGVTHWDAEARQREVRASRRLTVCLTVVFALVLGMSAWLVVSTGVPDVSAAAAAADARSTPQVPYFPSLYVNPATEAEPTSPTF